MSNANPEFMKRAIALATQNVLSGKGGPFGAVIVKDGRIVAEAANSVTATNDPTAHAEVNAIRLACHELGTFVLDDCDIYTSCEPCPMCLAATYWARMKTIYYGNTPEDAARAGFDDSYLYKEMCLPRDARAIPSVGLLHDEAWECFQAWIDAEKKVLY